MRRRLILKIPLSALLNCYTRIDMVADLLCFLRWPLVIDSNESILNLSLVIFVYKVRGSEGESKSLHTVLCWSSVLHTATNKNKQKLRGKRKQRKSFWSKPTQYTCTILFSCMCVCVSLSLCMYLTVCMCAGIAFEQGHILPTPETVPFRLTRDIVDGMGVTGVEGVFRR